MKTVSKKKRVIGVIASLLVLCLGLVAFSVYAADQKPEEIPDEAWFYLSDFPPMENIVSGWDGADFMSVNAGLTNPADLWLCTQSGTNSQSAVKYSHGMSLHAPGKVVYDISDMNATRFTCLYGANAKSTSGKGSVGLKIYTDLNAPGEYLYCLNSAEDAARLGVERFPVGQYDQAVEIDIAIPAGATRLYLEPTDGGDGNDSDHAVFAEPKLFANYAYLSNMEAAELSAGWGNALLDNSVNGEIRFNTLYKGSAGGTANHKQVVYEEGICVHAPSTVTYDIEGMGVKRFTAFCGISANAGNYNPTTTFKVFFDGVEVHSITKTKDKTNVAIGENIDLKVPEGTKTITLTAQAVGNNDGNHTCWAYPRLFGDNLDKVMDLSLAIENDGIFLDKEHEVKVLAENAKGAKTELDSSEVRITAESSNITVKGNKVKAIAIGQAVLKVEYLKGSEVVLTKTFELDIFDENTSWEITSPNGQSKMKVFLANGKALYTATTDGKTYVQLSQMGLKTTTTDYSEGLEFVSATAPKEIKESYDMISGKFSTYENHCNERTITLKKGSAAELTLIIRAYDDGVAFRYAIANKTAIKIKDEVTEMVIPESSYTWYQPNTGGKYPNTHEQQFGYGETTRYLFDITLPFMYKTPEGVNVVVSEADLDGSYCGSVLKSVSENAYKFGFPEQQTNSAFSKSTLVSAGANFESPWRAFVAGDEETIFLSTMFEDLSDPCVIEDTSWIVPGITSWSWMSGMRSGGNPYDFQANKRVIKEYIDFAAEMGWDYYILDEGWMKRISNDQAKQQGLTGGRDWLPNGGWYTGFYNYTEEIVEYANKKGIGLIAWVHVSQINDPKNDYEQMDRLFAQFHEYGIKGIKADFFNSENQETIQLYNKIYEKCVKYQLLANLHGSNKPTGERRTYPNVINREAIYGEELSSTKASQMVIQSYLRGLVGPTDITPYIYPSGGSDTTMAHQLALSVIYESGMTCFASTIDEYRELKDHVKQYFYAYPTTWHDSRFISGTIGEDMTVARQSRDGRWYVGGITTTAKEETVVLDFLEEGVEYTAYVYTDNSRVRVKYEEMTVKKGDEITAKLSKNGGYVIKIVKSVPDGEELTVDVTVEATVNNLGNVTLSPEGFEFLLQNAEGGDPITLTTDASGKASIAITFAKGHIGKTYTYQLSQVAGDKEHVTYSGATHTVTITIVQDFATNKLAAKFTVDGKETDAPVARFENTYDYSETAAPAPQPQEGNDSTGLWIVLGVAGGAVVLAAVATLIVVLRKKSRSATK
jgi:pilin isopeptide linkage protein